MTPGMNVVPQEAIPNSRSICGRNTMAAVMMCANADYIRQHSVF